MCYDLSRSSFFGGSSEKGLNLTRFFGIALLLLTSAVGCLQKAHPQIKIWFLEVEREGGYWVGPNFLANLGLNPKGDSPPAISLSLEGNDVPLLPLRTSAGWGFFFFTQYHRTRYSSYNPLKLEVGKSGPQIANSGFCPPPSVKPLPWALHFIHLEEDLYYLPQAELEIPWLWKPLYAPGKLAFTLNLTDALEGPVTITVQIWSHSDFPSKPDHELQMWWDETLIGKWQWDGMGVYQFQAHTELNKNYAKHELTLESSLPLGTKASVLWVDYIEVIYRRIVKPEGEMWLAEGEALKVEGSSPWTYAIDVTNPLEVKGCLIPSDGVISTVPGHRYWIGNPQKAMTPTGIRPSTSFNPNKLDEVEYLVIAPEGFHKTLVPLLEHRERQGLRVGLVEPKAIYDSFSGGRADPQAICSLVNSLPSLRYLLIVGDGTAVPGGYDGPSGKFLVVSPFTRTREIGETPADVLLGTNNANEPVVAVGRLPATSPRELAFMVDKILDWENSGESLSFLLVYDDGPEFKSVAEEIKRTVEAKGFNANFAQDRSEVLKSLNTKGKTAVVYFGHASLTRLGDEGILRIEDAQGVAEPALITVWGCLAAHFVHPHQESLAEAWLRSPNKAVAFLGPAGATTLAEQKPLALAFYHALGQEQRIGDAWLKALKELKGSQVILSYILLGDPAMLIGSY